MKRLSILLIAVLLCTAASGRERVLLDTGWKFAFGNASDPAKDFGCGTEYFNYLTKASSIHNEGPYAPKFDDSAWEDVRLPHDWVAELPCAPGASHSHGYKTVGYKYPETSVGWYRKALFVDSADEGKRLFLRFDGIIRDARIWFNGFYLGCEPSGYAVQVYEVTDYVNWGGSNLICVRAESTLEEGWYYEGAGIYRDVWLEKAPQVCVEPFGTFVYSEYTAGGANLCVEAELSNGSLVPCTATVEQCLLDAAGNEVARSLKAVIPLKAKERRQVCQILSGLQPHEWSTADPYLYTVVTRVSAGGVQDEYTTRTGFRQAEFTSDRGFLLNGEQLKLKGVNLHQDHAGVGAAVPEALMRWRVRQLKSLGCNAIRSSHNPMAPALLDICDEEGILVIDENRLSGVTGEPLRLLENMIRTARNHPSVILWSCGNEEWGMENTVQGTRVAASMREYARLLDPTRHSTLANAGGGEMIKGTDVAGYNYIVQNNVQQRRAEHPEWKVVGTEETTGCGTRGVYFNDNPGRMRAINLSSEGPGVENVIERGWRFYADNPWTAGVFFWTGFDYRGEPNPLHYPATLSEFGILDYAGFPKDEAWYLKAWWTEEPVLHVFPHWNLKGHEGEDVDIWVYGNCDEVSLKVNGKLLPRQKMPRNGHLKWTAKYKPGKVEAIGYKGGKRVLTQTVETTGAPAKLSLSSDKSVLQGRDVAVITVSVLDSKGRQVPDACPMLRFSIEGSGRILGAGNGDPSYLGPEHCKDGKTFAYPAFNGLCSIIVRSDGEEETTVTVSADGLAPASIAFGATSFSVL